MKKIIAFLLSMTMVLGLCACGSSGAEADYQGLQAGYCRESIVADFAMPMSGYGDASTRLSQGLVSNVYITCIAVKEAAETVLLFTVDMCSIGGELVEDIRKSITDTTGIPGEKVYFGATHTHSGPGQSSSAAGKMFQAFLQEVALKAAQTAIADLAPATMLTTSKTVEGMTFVRHYKIVDGSYAGANFGSFNLPIEGHATDANELMVLIQFDRAEDKKDIVMMNWQAHPANAKTEIGYNNLSADFVGAIRDKFEADTGMHLAYFTGSSGNQNMDSRIAAESHHLKYNEYGQKMAEHAIAALSELKQVEGAGIKTNRMSFTAKIDHSWDDMVPQAQQVINELNTNGTGPAKELGYTFGFSSHYQAKHIISRAAMDETGQLEINAFSIGGVGFITGTYEMFSTSAHYIRENSPFDTTFIITANGGYIPCAEAYDYRSYEAETGTYAKGTAEELEQEFVRMLGEVK